MLGQTGYVAAFVIYLLGDERARLPSHWTATVAVILCGLIALNAAQLSSNQTARLLFFFECTLALMIGYPLGDDLAVETILLATVIYNLLLYASPNTHLLVSLAIVALSLLLQRPVNAWGITLPSPETAHIATHTVVLLASVAASNVLYRQSLRLDSFSRRLRRREEAVVDLMKANVAFQEYASAVGDRSIAEERSRLSRDIHDSIGYTLTNIKMLTQAALASVSDGDRAVEPLLTSCKDQAQAGIDEMRRALRSIRSIKITRPPLPNALVRLTKTFARATGVRVDLSLGNLGWQLASEAEYFLLHAVQEGMTNAFRHGKAENVSVQLWVDQGTLYVHITDDGTATKDIEEGIGLQGMKERAGACGGDVTYFATDAGFTLSAWIPLQSEV